jgi:hypothetical protein
VNWGHIIHVGGQAFDHMSNWFAGAYKKGGSKGKWAAQSSNTCSSYLKCRGDSHSRTYRHGACDVRFVEYSAQNV